jgi:predicted transcriptional regulator
MEKQQIIDLPCLKHVKIYKLKQLGLKDKEIAYLLGTNPGHVYNALKAYKNNPEKVSKANAITAA